MGQDINCVANIYPNAARAGGHRRIAAHMHARTWLALTSLSLLASCGSREEPPAPQRADWVLETRVVFFEADGKTARPAPKQDLRLWMP